MKKGLKKICIGITLSFIFVMQIAICNTTKAYANTKNTTKIEEHSKSQSTEKKDATSKKEKVSSEKKELSKQKLGIGIAIILVVLIIGRAITPKEAFK